MNVRKFIHVYGPVHFACVRMCLHVHLCVCACFSVCVCVCVCVHECMYVRELMRVYEPVCV